jgi:hypothetical protein
MIGPGLEAAENKHFEGALQELHPLRWTVYGRHTTYIGGKGRRVKEFEVLALFERAAACAGAVLDVCLDSQRRKTNSATDKHR